MNSLSSADEAELRCVKCEEPGVIRVTGMTYEGMFHTWHCPNPGCMYQRERAGSKT